MDNRITKLKNTKEKIESISKKLQWVFFAIFVVYSIVIIAIIIGSIISLTDLNYVGPDSVLGLLPMICNTIAGGVGLLIIGFMFRNISKGISPFSVSIIKAITALGFLFLLAFVSGLFINPGSTVGVESDSLIMEVDYDNHSNDVANIDLRSLLTSIVCFALAAIFRYGAVLQTEVDDLL